jgi:hypothetical protein
MKKNRKPQREVKMLSGRIRRKRVSPNGRGIKKKLRASRETKPERMPAEKRRTDWAKGLSQKRPFRTNPKRDPAREKLKAFTPIGAMERLSSKNPSPKPISAPFASSFLRLR